VPDEKSDGVPAEQPDGGSAPDEGARGRMRFQDESTTPREPTLAERRAREIAARRAEEAERRAAEEQERSARRRKRILVGAGVTVGVVALIAVGYSAVQDDEVQAQCVDEEGVIVDDSNCVTPAASSTAHYGGGFYPIFIGGGGRQYHYTYGGTGTVGERVQGGTTTVPKEGTRVTTRSGKTLSGSSSGSSISRGGLGVSGGKSGSGS
jgi:hypothetical protein